jgi:hypothetical protein
MKEGLAFIIFAFAVTPTYLMIAAGLVLVVIVLGAALFLFRSSGKKKGAATDTPGADWQRQQGQQGAPAAWNQQPGMGNASDNAWGQQQQQQQPGAWGAQSPAQQPSAGAWGAQSPQQQPQANPWETQMPVQQQPSAWGAQSAQQQPTANSWGNANPAQQPSAWGNSTPNSPSTAGAGLGNNAWDATFMPQQAKTGQDSWSPPQQPQQPSPFQQGTPSWGSQSNTPSPAQPQAQTVYSGNNNSNPSWGQSGQSAPANDPWGQAAPAQQNNWAQPAPVNDPWNQAAPSAQNSWGAQAPPMQPLPSTSQAQGFGNNMSANVENDKTMIRPAGPQGGLGIVRVEEGKEPGRVYEVRKDELSIGRSRESDIFLEDLAVSRLHAKIVSLGSGNYALKDEGSANGTKVNGQLVNKYQTYPLQEGDRIQLGQTVLVFAKR